MATMLMNASHPEELRVALLRNQQLFDLDIERAHDGKKKANLYKAHITRIEPSLEAIFVDFGAKRQGFLPFKEVSPIYYRKPIPADATERPPIKELLTEGQELLIQVEKEERGNKGAALTTFITLAGCYLVLMPNSPRGGGISRRIEGPDRDELREIIRQLTIPEGMNIIIRTAGVGKSQEDIQWDLEVLVNLWEAIQQAYDKQQPAPFLIHQEGDIVIRSVRDNLRRSIDEIIVDNQEVYIKTKNYLQQVRPSFVDKLKLYNDAVPLFSRYQLESQIETAYQRQVLLPSGGSIVIDTTEALVAIDINSAKATGGSNIEATALNTNLEAADEIARQMRLRDLGGLIVIDFIDMSATKNQREVENRLREALKNDRARVQIGHISRFGLLEMSRQRLHLSLGEIHQNACPLCNGRGSIRDAESLTLSILRLIEEEVIKFNPSGLNVQLPAKIATYMLNEKRDQVIGIEKRHGVYLTIIANPHLESPHYKIERVRGGGDGRKHRSYDLIDEPELEVVRATSNKAERNEPAIKHVVAPARHTKPAKEGILTRICKAFSSGDTEDEKPVETVTEEKEKPRHHNRPRRHHSSSAQRDGDRRDQQKRHHNKGQSGYRRRGPRPQQEKKQTQVD